MSVSKLLVCTGALVLLAGLGCKTEGGAALHYGEAFYANSEHMVADPTAGQKEESGSVDFEGNTVETLMSRYRRGQVQTQTTNLPNSILQQAGSSKAK